MHSSDQAVVHSAGSEGMEAGAHSSGTWGVADLTRLRTARWSLYTPLQWHHGTEDDGVPPTPATISGWRVTSDAERSLMKCEGCYDMEPMVNWSVAVPAFMAFARKVD